MGGSTNLTERLRHHIVGEMHIGHLRAGDRLPTYREIAGEWDVDHRAVAAAYRQLEADGLVEIRIRQGVFLREQEKIGGEMPTETAAWVADEVLLEAWRRRMKIPELPELIRRCTASAKLDVACVESTLDHQWVICRELSDWFGFNCSPVEAEDLASRPTSKNVHVVDIEGMPREIREADLLVSTLFHAPALRATAEALGKPYVIVRMHPSAAGAVERHLEKDDLTVVCRDPRFADRVQIFAGDRLRGNIRVVLASEHSAIEQIDPHDPVLVSRAVAAQLKRDFNYIVDPHIPAFDADSARELARVLIRLNLEAVEASRGRKS